MLRLKRVLMTILADRGLTCRSRRMARRCGWSIRSGSGRPSTPARRRTAPRSRSGSFGTPQFKRALDWAEQERLIAIGEIGDITYIWLTRPDPEDAEEEQG